MRETQAIIERVRRVSADIEQIDLSVDRALAQLKPGQSLFAAPTENPTWNPYLREQWIPVDLTTGRVTVEIPAGRNYAPGAVMSLLSPVGRAIPLRSPLAHLLLIAEDTFPTPLILLARQAIKAGAAVTLVIGGQAARYPLELLPPEVEIIRRESNDWNWPEQVETLNWADQVIALAPVTTQQSVYGKLYDTVSQLRHQVIPDHLVCGLYYPRLACGAGACMACQIPTNKATLLACSDGPAVDLKLVRFS
jgi:hypothetical protein